MNLFAFDDAFLDEKVIDGRREADALPEPMSDFLGVERLTRSSRVVITKHFGEAAGLGGVLGIGQNEPEPRLVLPPYPLQSNF